MWTSTNFFGMSFNSIRTASPIKRAKERRGSRKRRNVNAVNRWWRGINANTRNAKSLVWSRIRKRSLLENWFFFFHFPLLIHLILSISASLSTSYLFLAYRNKNSIYHNTNINSIELLPRNMLILSKLIANVRLQLLGSLLLSCPLQQYPILC